MPAFYRHALVVQAALGDERHQVVSGNVAGLRSLLLTCAALAGCAHPSVEAYLARGELELACQRSRAEADEPSRRAWADWRRANRGLFVLEAEDGAELARRLGVSFEGPLGLSLVSLTVQPAEPAAAAPRIRVQSARGKGQATRGLDARAIQYPGFSQDASAEIQAALVLIGPRASGFVDADPQVSGTDLLLGALTLGNYRSPDTRAGRESHNTDAVRQRMRAVRAGGPELRAAAEALAQEFRREGRMYSLQPDSKAAAPVLTFQLESRVGRCNFSETLRLKLPEAPSLLEALRLARGAPLPAEE
jgi:hypothetical protein